MKDIRFGRRLAAPLALAAAAALGAGAAGAVNYSIVPIDAGAGVCTLLNSKTINSARQVVGGFNSGTGFHAFSWTQGGGMVDLGTLPGALGFSIACGVNNSGQVVGYSNNASGYHRAFSWTQSGGMVDIGFAGGYWSYPNDVNNSGQVVGYSSDSSGNYHHAFSWMQGGGTADLGTLPGGGYSVAYGLNDSGQVVGYSNNATGWVSAFSRMPGGPMVDLGTLPGGFYSYAYGVNDSGQVVGVSNTSSGLHHAFSWTQGAGMVDLGTLPGGWYSVALGVNNSGRVIGYSQPSAGYYRAYSWTQAGGMVEIGLPGGFYSYAHGLNSAGQVVGYAFDQNFLPRAYVWTAADGLVDLNDAIATKPANWHAYEAFDISDDGAIVVASNTGLVLLVPEPLNVNVPIGGPIAANDPIGVGGVVQASASFTDADTTDTHTASWGWGDGSAAAAGTVSESNGVGTVAGSHVYASAGIYPVTLTITDDTGRSVQVTRDIVVYDPSAGFVTGGGWIQSPPGAYKANELLAGRATFGFVSKYQKGAKVPSGKTEFQFQTANLNFHSDTYEWLVVAGARAQFKGVGTINGTGEYKFLLTAVDGNRLGESPPDRFRIKLWYYDATLEQDVVVYDNQIDSSLIGTSTEGSAIGGGSIVIHTK